MATAPSGGPTSQGGLGRAPGERSCFTPSLMSCGDGTSFFVSPSVSTPLMVSQRTPFGLGRVTDVAWDRVLGEKEREIARLVDEGVLTGTRKRGRLYINTGSFYDWLGEPVPLLPEWGMKFEILPDRRAGEVRRLQQARQAAREAFTHVPLSLGVDLVGRKLGHSPKDSTRANEVAEAVGRTLREGIQMRWREVLEVEQLLEEIAGEFDGEDPARPWEREALEDGKKRLEELHLAAQTYVGPFKLPGPDEEEQEQVREVIRREGEPWS